jgi:RNA polymerase primary sigma factor
MRQLKIEKSITNRSAISFNKYLFDVSQIEMITPQEEFDLAARIREGDTKALDKLVKSNLRFVISVAKQYQNFGVNIQDLVNEGNIGLIKAAQKFDETRGFKFISYAVWWIRQMIQKAINDQGKIVRLPSNKSGLLMRINKAEDTFMQKNERLPDAEELAEILEVSEKEIKDTYTSKFSQYELDAPLTEDDATTRMEKFDSSEPSLTEESLTNASLKVDITRMLDKLTPREQKIIQDYYGIGVRRSKTIAEISSEIGMSRESIRKIRNKAISRLKTNDIEHLKEYFG